MLNTHTKLHFNNTEFQIQHEKTIYTILRIRLGVYICTKVKSFIENELFIVGLQP